MRHILLLLLVSFASQTVCAQYTANLLGPGIKADPGQMEFSPQAEIPYRVWPTSEQGRRGSTFGSVGAALGLGAAGFGLGALAGGLVKGDCTGDFCSLEAALVGGMIGAGLGIPAGAHLGNRRLGNLPLGLLSGAVLAGSSVWIFSDRLDQDLNWYAFGMAPLTVAVAVAVERLTGRARGDRAQKLLVLPTRSGGVTLVAAWPL